MKQKTLLLIYHCLKGTVHPKKIFWHHLLLFHSLSFFCWTQKKMFCKTSIVFFIYFLLTMTVNGCQQQAFFKTEKIEKIYNPWGRINDEVITIFGWTVPSLLFYRSCSTYSQSMNTSLDIRLNRNLLEGRIIKLVLIPV